MLCGTENNSLLIMGFRVYEMNEIDFKVQEVEKANGIGHLGCVPWSFRHIAMNSSFFHCDLIYSRKETIVYLLSIVMNLNFHCELSNISIFDTITKIDIDWCEMFSSKISISLLS